MQGSCKADNTTNAPWGRSSHTVLRACKPWASGRFKSSNTKAQVSVDDKRYTADESDEAIWHWASGKQLCTEAAMASAIKGWSSMIKMRG
jgi:hypothetical protein